MEQVIMFTGIVKSVGTAAKVSPKENYLVLTVSHMCDEAELIIGDSVACDGACLTIVSIGKKEFTFEISQETLARTIAADYHEHSKINLELPVRFGDRLGGHFVTGHIDIVGSISEVSKVGESVALKIAFNELYDKLVIEKGSIAVNGVSLTVNETGRGWCSVNLIPHTMANTNFSLLKKSSKVNLEFDLIGKYAIKSETEKTAGQITFEKLKESGW